MDRNALYIVRRDVKQILLGLGLVAASITPALAVDLSFSPDCRSYAAISVAAPQTGIAFRKNPVNAVTRAATATVFSITGLHNIVIPAGASSCFFAVIGNDNYCFQARTAAAIVNVNAVAGNNHMGVPACH
jgi:hypothetical protein